MATLTSSRPLSYRYYSGDTKVLPTTLVGIPFWFITVTCCDTRDVLVVTLGAVSAEIGNESITACESRCEINLGLVATKEDNTTPVVHDVGNYILLKYDDKDC